jgi:ethanolaminephosphotransferase
MPILSGDDAEYLRSYQYSGGDLSILYRYALSPFSEYLVDKAVPLWLAPNIITAAALSSSILTYLLDLHECPELPCDGPNWIYLVAAVAIFAYQTLDNMDGKQARRTASSSALGMLFDHGIDAMNCTIASTVLACSLNLHKPFELFWLWAIATVPFYFATWWV